MHVKVSRDRERDSDEQAASVVVADVDKKVGNPAGRLDKVVQGQRSLTDGILWVVAAATAEGEL
jgi:hypothetical protein